MRGRFLLPLAAAAGIALLAMSPAGAAQPYPPAEPVLTVSSGTVVVGETVELTGTGFEPGEEVEIVVSTSPFSALQLEEDAPEQSEFESGSETIAMVPVARSVAAQDSAIDTADGDGTIFALVTLNEVGLATITATGLESDLSASVVVTVVAAGDALATTGSDVWRLVRIGGAVIGVGGLLLLATLVWRPRRDRIKA